LRAAVPAMMYYFILGLNVHLYASRKGLYGAPKGEIPKLWDVLKKQGLLLLPLLVIVIALVYGYSPTMSALAGLITLLIVCWFKPESRLTWTKIYDALRSAGMAGREVGIVSASAGIILGVFMLTGLGTKIASILVQISGGSVLFLLIISMVTSIIFGMGMPTTPCYILLATLVGPALTDMGVPKLLAHLFLFYFGMLSMITPPVAMAAYAAAAISGGSFYKTGFLAWKMALPIFIIPFFFVYYPGFVLIGSWDSVLLSIFKGFIGLSACCVALTGYLRRVIPIWERLLLMIGGLGLIHQSMLTDVIGIGIITFVLFLEFHKPVLYKTAGKIAISEEE
ncbi:MAG: TRAP transporter large permease subunit, partial [Deltaproteobacteria bacterium]